MTQEQMQQMVEAIVDETIKWRRNLGGEDIGDAEIARARPLLLEALEKDDGDQQPPVPDEEIRAFVYKGREKYGDLWADAMDMRFPNLWVVANEFWNGEFADPGDKDQEGQFARVERSIFDEDERTS